MTDGDYANVLLVQAITRGDLLDVRRALRCGASPETAAHLRIGMGLQPEFGKAADTPTPLMSACALGHLDIVHCLLEAGAMVGRQDLMGWTALSHALAAGEVGIFRALAWHAGSVDLDVELLRDDIVAHRAEILSRCEASAGDAAAADVRRELDAPGFLLEWASVSGPVPEPVTPEGSPGPSPRSPRCIHEGVDFEQPVYSRSRARCGRPTPQRARCSDGDRTVDQPEDDEEQEFSVHLGQVNKERSSGSERSSNL